MHLRSQWVHSPELSIPGSKALDSSRISPRAISIRRSTGKWQCSAPAESDAKRPAATCYRAVLPKSITSRAASSAIWNASRKWRAGGAENALCLTSASRSARDCGSAQQKATPMTELKTLSERIDALEARLMFQDETIETLNKTITEQWLLIDALTRQVTALGESLQEAAHAPDPADEPPPHY